MQESQLHNFLSQLNLIEKVIFRNKDNNTYAIDFQKDIHQKIKSILPDAIYFFNSQPLILIFLSCFLEKIVQADGENVECF